MVPSKISLSWQIQSFLAAALAASTAASSGCAAPAEEGEGATSDALETSSGTCSRTINKLEDIRNRFLDENHSAVWAFQTDLKSSFTRLAAPPDDVFVGSPLKQVLSRLDNVTFDSWKPSDKVRVRDARLSEEYLVVRGTETGGVTLDVYIFQAATGAEVAQARSSLAGTWSWACPPPATTPVNDALKSQPSDQGCNTGGWCNWPNWNNWNNWLNWINH